MAQRLSSMIPKGCSEQEMSMFGCKEEFIYENNKGDHGDYFHDLREWKKGSVGDEWMHMGAKEAVLVYQMVNDISDHEFEFPEEWKDLSPRDAVNKYRNKIYDSNPPSPTPSFPDYFKGKLPQDITEIFNEMDKNPIFKGWSDEGIPQTMWSLLHSEDAITAYQFLMGIEDPYFQYPVEWSSFSPRNAVIKYRNMIEYQDSLIQINEYGGDKYYEFKYSPGKSLKTKQHPRLNSLFYVYFNGEDHSEVTFCKNRNGIYVDVKKRFKGLFRGVKYLKENGDVTEHFEKFRQSVIDCDHIKGKFIFHYKSEIRGKIIHFYHPPGNIHEEFPIGSVAYSNDLPPPWFSQNNPKIIVCPDHKPTENKITVLPIKADIEKYDVRKESTENKITVLPVPSKFT